jgi:septal ring factor EnvC (AmiA/AmiB activator)
MLGACLLLSLATVRGQAPQAPASNAARDTVRQLEAELEARRAKLQELVAQHARLAAEIEGLQAERRVTVQRLQEAKARLVGEGDTPAAPFCVAITLEEK